MANLQHYFASYTEYHQTKGNKVTHYLGIPMIVFSTFGLLSAIQLPIDLGLFVWASSSLFYFRLERRRSIPFAILTFALYWTSRLVAIEIHWGLFILGWIFQGIGHYVYEKKSPAFLTNLSHILIGPFWIFCRFWR